MIHTLTLDTGSNVLRLRSPDGEKVYRPTSGSAYDLFTKLRDVASTAPGEVVGQLEDYCELMDLGPSAGLVPNRPTTERRQTIENGDAGTTTADMPGLVPSVLPGGKPLKGMRQPFKTGPDRSKGGVFKLEADGSMSDSAVSSVVDGVLKSFTK